MSLEERQQAMEAGQQREQEREAAWDEYSGYDPEVPMPAGLYEGFVIGFDASWAIRDADVERLRAELGRLHHDPPLHVCPTCGVCVICVPNHRCSGNPSLEVAHARAVRERSDMQALATALAEALRDTFAVATALDTKLPEGGYAFGTEYLSAPEVLARAVEAGLLNEEGTDGR